MSAPPIEERFHRGSFITAHYDLRVTRRCLEDDLSRRVGDDFELEDLYESVEIITALINQRRKSPTGTRQVTPLTSGHEMWVLAYGNNHRGATWHQAPLRVLWLCAYGWHRSGEDDDAFNHFRALDAAGQLVPAPDDYDDLFRERDERFADLAPGDAQQLLSQARDSPGAAFDGRIGGEHGVAVTVEAADDLEALWVAVDGTTFPPDWVGTLFAAFAPDAAFSDWEWPSSTFPSRDLREGEWSAVLHSSLG